MKQKEFFIVFKGISIEQLKQVFLEGKSPTLKIAISFIYFKDTDEDRTMHS